MGSARAPLIQAAGTDHVIFSKKLIGILVFIGAASMLIFFSIEQQRISNNWALSRAALQQNSNIKAQNLALSDASDQLQEEENSLMNLYSTWLDEDQQEIELSQDQLASLKKQVTALKQSVDTHSSGLDDKDKQLTEKEKSLPTFLVILLLFEVLKVGL